MTQPLEGIRVLAVEHYQSGPYGSMLLADAGAEVIKIERPGSGDPARQVSEYVRDGKRFPITFLRNNRNKKSVTLNLKSERGRELFLALVKESDVVYENLSPSEMNRFGLGYEVLREIKPSLIYASVSGFGHDDVLASPYTEYPAFDIVAQAMSGLMWLPTHGSRPTWLGITLTDLYPGVLAAIGVMMALRVRDQTGQGQRVDLSMYDAGVMLNEKAIGLYTLLGRGPTSATDLQMTNQLGIFRARDGFFALGIVNDQTWPSFCGAISREDLIEDPQLRTVDRRTQNLPTILGPAIQAWSEQRSVDEAVQLLRDRAVPVGPVQRVPDLFSCPQLKAREMLTSFDYPGLGPITVVANPIKTDQPQPAPSPPPLLGQHTDALLTEILGLDGTTIEKLRSENAI